MQQTKLDRWLQTKYVNETLVMTIRQPPYIPPGIELKELPQSLNNQFRFQMVIRDEGDLNDTIAALKKLSQTFTTRVRQREGTAKKYFANENGKSFTNNLASALLAASMAFSAVIFFPAILVEYAETYGGPVVADIKKEIKGIWGDTVGEESSEPESTSAIRESNPSANSQ